MTPDTVLWMILVALGAMLTAVALVFEGVRAMPLVLLLVAALALLGLVLVVHTGRRQRP